MTIDAMYAGTTVGEDRSGIYQVEADLAASENTTISVGYRDLMDGVYGLCTGILQRDQRR